MKSALSNFAAASALALLAACGGGDGSPAAKDVAITSANQNNVARASLDGGSSVALAQGSLVGNGTSGPLSASTLVRRAIAAAASQRKAIASVGARPAAVSSGSQPCGVSGAITVSFDDRDGNGQLSNGDVLTAAFAQCRDSDTSSIDGTVTITLTATPTGSTLDASAGFENVAVVDGGISSTISGNVSLHETDGTTLSEVQLVVGSGGLNVSVASSAYDDSVSFESGMTFAASRMGGAALTSVSLDGSFSASSIDGRVTVTTQVPLVTADGASYPNAGVVKIVGASGSTVLATVLDATQVQLQLDTNGDGTYESTVDVPWTTLMP
jgi:hypothetical protein